MEKIIIKRSRLEGVVKVSGAKNNVLPLLAASILTEQKIILNNSPNELLDVKIMLEMLNKLGKNCIVSENFVEISEKTINTDLVWNGRSIRSSLNLLGALVSRFGSAKVPLPGGCNLGDRKYDIHLMIFERMGVRVWEEDGYLCAKINGRLNGNKINLPIRSTGATINAIFCGVLASGITEIWNPHIRPEIINLIYMLNKMGAKIRVHGQKVIIIDGVSSLKAINHRVIPDNMEALTWAIAAVITNGDIEILDFPFSDLEIPLIHLKESGMKFYKGANSLIVKGGEAYPIDISTGPYPGINSDMQPLFSIYGMHSKGISHVIDLRFPGRYAYMEELKKMGAKYEIEDKLLKIYGGHKLKGAEVNAIDLRAGISMLLAGLTAKGETIISNSWQISRGYENLFNKLKKLNVDLKCI